MKRRGLPTYGNISVVLKKLFLGLFLLILCVVGTSSPYIVDGQIKRITNEEAKDFGIAEPGDAAGEAKGKFNDILVTILQTGLYVVATIATAVLLIGGVMYITSLGDDERAKRAKKLILYAVIGLLVIGMAALIVNVVIRIYRPAST